MNMLKDAIKKGMLWIDYGQIEDFYNDEHITLESLRVIRLAVDLAIQEKMDAA